MSFANRATSRRKYIEDRCQARTEDKNPKLVDFVPPISDEDGLGDAEDTMPLDNEAASHDANDDEAAAHEASDHEDPAI